MTLRIVRLYLSLSFCAAFSQGLTMAIYVLYLREHHLDYFETNLMNVAFFLTLFVLEIPTGAFADVFGRKASFVAASIFWALGHLTYGLSTGKFGFIFAEFLGAIGATLASGAFQAWLVDRLHHYGYTGSIRGFLFREQLYDALAAISGALIGAWLAAGDSTLPWLVSSACFLLTALISLLLMREEYFTRGALSVANGLKSIRSTMVEAIRFGRENENMRFLLVIGTAQFFAVQAPNMQWQPLFSDLGVGQIGMGVIMAGIQIVLLLGALIGPWFVLKARHERAALLTSQIAIGITIALTPAVGVLGSALFFFGLSELARGLFRPIKDAYLNDQITDRTQRATLLSFESMSHHGGGMLGLLVSGLVAEQFGVFAAWSLSGAVLVASAVLLLRAHRRSAT